MLSHESLSQPQTLSLLPTQPQTRLLLSEILHEAEELWQRQGSTATSQCGSGSDASRYKMSTKSPSKFLSKFHIYFIFWYSVMISRVSVLQLNNLFYVSSCFAQTWMTFHNMSSWMVCHQYGFFHVPLDSLMLSICSHTWSSWMVYHQCGFFHVFSSCLTVCICSHTGSSWMV